MNTPDKVPSYLSYIIAGPNKIFHAMALLFLGISIYWLFMSDCKLGFEIAHAASLSSSCIIGLVCLIMPCIWWPFGLYMDYKAWKNSYNK